MSQINIYGQDRAKEQTSAIVQDKSNSQDTCDAKQQAREKAVTHGKGDSPGQDQQPRARASPHAQVQGEGKGQRRSSMPGQ